MKRLEKDLARVGVHEVRDLLDKVRTLSKSRESVALQAAVATLYNGEMSVSKVTEEGSNNNSSSDSSGSEADAETDNSVGEVEPETSVVSGMQRHHEYVMESLRKLERHRIY